VSPEGFAECVRISNLITLCWFEQGDKEMICTWLVILNYKSKSNILKHINCKKVL